MIFYLWRQFPLSDIIHTEYNVSIGIRVIEFCFDRKFIDRLKISTNSCFFFAHSYSYTKEQSLQVRLCVINLCSFFICLFNSFFFIFSSPKIYSWKSPIHPKWSEWLCLCYVSCHQIICAFFGFSIFQFKVNNISSRFLFSACNTDFEIKHVFLLENCFAILGSFRYFCVLIAYTIYLKYSLF